MHRRRVATFAVFLLLALTIYQVSAFATRPQDKRIPGFHVVKKLPATMVAGSTCGWKVSFVNPKSEEGLMNITLEITEKKTIIGFGEFHVEGTLESYDNPPRKHYISTLTFTEASGGTFQSLQNSTDKRFNDITLRISSVPNLMPGKYTFTLTITIQYESGQALSATISPTSVTLDVGQSQLFTSSVTGGTLPYTYRWYLNDDPVSDAKNPTWNFTPASAGFYTVYVRVTDSLGMHATSNTATVTVNRRLSVSISPSYVDVRVGESKLFTSTVSGGTSPYSYQWYLNGILVSGATSSKWTFTPASAGFYTVYVKVTDSLGMHTTSNTAYACAKSR